MNPILVAGTGSWKGENDTDWYCPGHPFGEYLQSKGVGPTYAWGTRNGGLTAAPFVWSTGLAGIPWLTNKKEWQAGGAALAYFIASTHRIPGDQTAVIAHSHGLQIVLYACAYYDLRIQALISVGSPVREDMKPIASAARPKIDGWLHLHSDGTDRWQWFGELFDGHLGIVREHPLADSNDLVPGVSHSKLLRNPDLYHLWEDRGWLNWITTTESNVPYQE